MSLKILATEFFAKLRKDGGYYVDKTRFLEQFLKGCPDVTLFTRPRRFGKTLFMSMLAEFFDIRKQGDGQNLFEGLYISSNEKLCQEWMHQYPVISISLKSVDKSTFADALEDIEFIISNICSEHQYLLNSSALTSEVRKLLKQLCSMKAKTTILSKSLFILTQAMHKHYGKPVILLIDEYDVPVARAADRGYYDEMILFMRNFLSDALKTNPCLKFAILTGALRITKESIFTGLNNLMCFDISSPPYADVFGFTQDEVDKMLADAGCEEKRDIIREWYDGYQFGERTDMYCPWSIMSYLDDLQDGLQDGLQEQHITPKAYWVSTSGNALARDFAKRLPDEANVYGNFAALLAGEPIAARLNPSMNYIDIFTSADNFWTLLYLTGYLTLASEPGPNDGVSLLVIPNREVREVFQKELQVLLKEILPESLRTALCDALWKQDAQDLEKQLTAVLEGCSFHDAKEAWYHGMMYGILLPNNKSISSNRESGSGRCDLIVPDKENLRAAILEFKRVPSVNMLDSGVQEALKQITSKNYDEGPRKEGYKSILHIGIAFFGKSVKVGFGVPGKTGCHAS